MRGLVVYLTVAFLCLGSPVRAQDAALSATDRRAIERVISSQLDAFRRDAGDVAFGFASPNIQSMFGDAAHFMGMVRQSYSPLYRSRSFSFEQLEQVEGRITQRVMVIGSDGAPALAIYTMQRDPNGTWRIDGCTLTRPAEVTT